VNEEDIVGELVVVVDDIAVHVDIRFQFLHVATHSSSSRTYVKYTILSLPLFFGTVKGASGSSTL
jgi:hypothetical protein